MSTSLSLRKQGCKSASYEIYTLYYIHKKVRLSVFYLNNHKYSLNCKKEWWTIFFLWASLTHHSLFLSNISKFSKTSSNPRIFFNSYPTFLASWNMYLLKGETFFSPMIRWNSLFSNSSGFLHQNNHRGTLSWVDKYHTISGSLINFAQYAWYLFTNHICQLPPPFACPLEFVTYFSKIVFLSSHNHRLISFLQPSEHPYIQIRIPYFDISDNNLAFPSL